LSGIGGKDSETPTLRSQPQPYQFVNDVGHRSASPHVVQNRGSERASERGFSNVVARRIGSSVSARLSRVPWRARGVGRDVPDAERQRVVDPGRSWSGRPNQSRGATRRGVGSVRESESGAASGAGDWGGGVGGSRRKAVCLSERSDVSRKAPLSPSETPRDTLHGRACYLTAKSPMNVRVSWRS
jgi:hypothetical protein